MEKLSESLCFGGRQQTWRHESTSTHTAMRFAAFLPPAAEHGPVPVLWWLSGLTCTEENFVIKAGAQRVAAELGLMLIAPDTSPRNPDLDGERVMDDPDGAYDFGHGAGFYLDATQEPWSRHYRMRSYIETELPALVGAHLPAAPGREAISGHSMGGHGALTIALRNPGRFRSVSAFAPIAAPMQAPWGVKAFTAYLGEDRAAWRPYDATALIEDGARLPEILVEQGEADPYLEEQLRLDLLEAACASAGQPLTLRRRPGYDHGYLFVSTFIEDHLRWHAERLAA